MEFNSIPFLIFFPIVTLIYFLMPHKFRWIWLLITSYFFYMCWNAKYAILMFFSTFTTYSSGLLIAKAKTTGAKKLWVALSFIINLAILAVFKYYDALIAPTLNSLFSFAHIGISVPMFDLLLPVGISFYTFQSLSYTVDVYRGDMHPVKNLGKYALFVSFFPQLVAGPIERTPTLVHQFDEVHYFDYVRIKEGLLRMLWGFFEKVVIADRLAVVVNQVYNNYTEYSGLTFAIATVMFAFQLLCDFSAYSNIALGSAKVMGFTLMENFKRPYFAKSVADFWRRWHISMSSWFRDYLYFPLGGSRGGKLKKCRNLMITFLVTGLWHGATWNMAIFGFLNGLFQCISVLTQSIREKVCKLLGLEHKAFSHRLFQVILIFTQFCLTLVFVRSQSFAQAVYILKQALHPNPWIFTDGTLLTLGLSQTEFWFACLLIVFYMAVQLFQRNRSIITEIGKQHIVLRWMVYLSGVMAIVIFGAYGQGYDAQQFIYFQF
ncbi:MAG: MBOAT family protein [Oscillospiraceae bacterium]|nr:MBOAT family protein [Oscillospiraceae bacterium]